MKEKSINLWILFLFVILGSSVINRANAMDPNAAEVDNQCGQMRPNLKKQAINVKRKQKFEEEGKPGSIKKQKLTDNLQETPGYIKVFDVTEYLDETKTPYRIVKINFVNDPGDIRLKSSTDETYQSCSPVDIKWKDAAQELADLVGMNAPRINNIHIDNIRNDNDLEYARVFFNKINQYATIDMEILLLSSNTSTPDIKKKVDNLHESIRNINNETMDMCSSRDTDVSEWIYRNNIDRDAIFRERNTDDFEEYTSDVDYPSSQSVDDDSSNGY